MTLAGFTKARPGSSEAVVLTPLVDMQALEQKLIEAREIADSGIIISST